MQHGGQATCSEYDASKQRRKRRPPLFIHALDTKANALFEAGIVYAAPRLSETRGPARSNKGRGVWLVPQ